MANDDIEIIDENSYCPKCGGCGYVGCCGIKDFFDEHVRGKTDCPYEEIFLSEIEEMVRAEHEELYKSIVQDDTTEILSASPAVQEVQQEASSAHEVLPPLRGDNEADTK